MKFDPIKPHPPVVNKRIIYAYCTFHLNSSDYTVKDWLNFFLYYDLWEIFLRKKYLGKG